MEDPQIFEKQPKVMKLDAGDYWWCACGRAETQPFCDGSHKGGPFQPQEYRAENAARLYFCGCKNSANKPLCDGSHKTL